MMNNIRSQLNIKAIMDSIANPIFAIDEAGNELFANDRAAKLLSSPKNLANYSTLIEKMKQVVEHGATHVQEMTFNDRHYMVSIEPIVDHRVIAGALADFNDVTMNQILYQEKNLLHQASAITITPLALEDMLDKILWQVINIMKVDQGSIQLLDQLNHELRIIAATNDVSNKYTRVKLGEGVSGFVAQTGQPLAIPSTKNDRRCLRARESVDYSMLSVPLISRGKVLGVLNLFNSAGVYFTESQVQIYTVVASRIGYAIETHQFNRVNKLKLDFAEKINSSIKIDYTFPEATKIINKMLEVHTSHLLVWYEKDEEIVNFSFPHHPSLPLHRQQLERHIGTKRYFDLAEHKNVSWVKQMSKHIMDKPVIFPVSSNGKLLGLLVVVFHPDRRVDSTTQTLCAEIANEVAMKVDNALLYESISREKELHDLINESTSNGLILQNAHGNIIYINPAGMKMLKIKKNIIGENILKLIKNPSEYSSTQVNFSRNLYKSINESFKSSNNYSFNFSTGCETHQRNFTADTRKVSLKNGSKGFLTTINDVTQIERLNKGLAYRVNQLRELFGITSYLSYDPDITIDKMVNRLPHLFEAKKAGYFKTCLSPDLFEIVSSVGWGKLKKYHKIDDYPIVKRLIDKKKIINYPQKSGPNTLLRASESWLAAPIIIDNKIVGALAVADKKSHRFTEEDVKLMNLVASKLQVQIANHRLMDRVNKEKERLEMVITHSADGMVVVDESNNVTLWNKAMEHLTGLSTDSVLGKSARRIFINQKDSVLDLIKKSSICPVDGNKSNCEVEITDKFGETYWVAVHYSHSKTSQSKNSGSILLLNDITRYKELEQAKNEFISVTTHELRSPITAIKGYLSMIYQGDAGPLMDKQKHFFSRAFQSTERLAKLVEDLLNVIRLEEKRLAFHVQPIDLPNIIEEVVMDYLQKAKEKKIHLKIVRLPQNIASGFADPGRTKQILSNLIENAINYTPSGGFVKVTLDSDPKDPKSLLVAIEDNGVGIPHDKVHQVFDRFQRIINPLSQYVAGFGLGLFITKSFVEQQGGKIWVESQPDKGSKFFFTLPTYSKPNKNISKEIYE